MTATAWGHYVGMSAAEREQADARRRAAAAAPTTREELTERLGHVPTLADEMAWCVCVVSCADDPPSACSLSGEPHVHPNAYPGDVFGPCPVHPDAPGDR